MVNLDGALRVKLVDEGELAGEIAECCHFNPENLGFESRCMAFSHDRKYFAWSLGDGFVRIILFAKTCNTNVVLSDSPTQSESHDRNWSRKIDCARPVLTMEFGPPVHSNNPYILATGLENGRIKVWNAVAGKILHTLSDHSSDVNGLSFADTGALLLISCSTDRTLKIWDMSDGGNMTLTIRGHSLPILDCKVCPTNHSLICSVGQGRSVIMWKLRHRRSVSQFQNLHGHLNDVVSCSWSPDGALLATASKDATVIVWDPVINQKIIILGHFRCLVRWLQTYVLDHGNNPSGPNFENSDGSSVATLCEDDRLRIWSINPSAPRQERLMENPGSKCKFSPGGSFIAVGNIDGSMSIMEPIVSLMSLRHLSRISIRRVLSAANVRSLGVPPKIENYLLYRIQ